MSNYLKLRLHFVLIGIIRLCDRLILRLDVDAGYLTLPDMQQLFNEIRTDLAYCSDHDNHFIRGGLCPHCVDDLINHVFENVGKHHE